jgi:putative peptide zinc metalloprotease protein
MTVNAVEHSIEQVFAHDPPGGLWARLAHAAAAPGLGGDLWGGIARRLAAGTPPATTGVWQVLAERADPAQYRPQAVPDVAEEQLTEGEQKFTVIRSPRGNYLRLTPPQRELWHRMNGTTTVAQLATYAFVEFKQLLPVGDLVTALKSEGFLLDQPVGVYRTLQAALEAQTAEGWGRRLLRALSGKTWRLAKIDGIYGAIYRRAGWLLFTRVFIALWLIVALVGLAAFVLALGRGAATYQVLELNGSVVLGLAALWCVLLISFVLHESAHALAVKHYGRLLRAGGLMLYYGMPAAFVDTSDIWRSPRRARIIVSAAGPMSDLLVGGLAALFAIGFPSAALSAIAFKLAFTCYVATLFNANPLLELDGYFILVDLLRLPALRRRALDFVRGPLWQHLRRHATLTHEERIFTFYGLLTGAYTVFAIIAAVSFWNRQLVAPIFGLLAGGPLQKLLGGLLLLGVVVPVLVGVLLVGWGIGRAVLAWVVRRGYGRRPALLAGLGSALALALAWLVGQRAPLLAPPLVPLLWALAFGALLAVRPDYRRAAIASTVNALLLTSAFAALAALGRALMPQSQLWIVADGLACIFLLVAGFAALLDVDLRLAPPRELLGTAVLLMLAFSVGGLVLFEAMRTWPGMAPITYIAVAAPAYFGALALALLLPHLFGLHDSRLIWSWALLWCAALTQTAAYIADIGRPVPALDLLAAGLWSAAWLVHLATLRQIAPDEIVVPSASSISEAQRLTRAFQLCYTGCYRLLRAVYGTRRAKALDDRMDVLAATANWDVTLDRERARINDAVLALPLDQQGARYAEVLRYTVSTIEEIAGASFARRAIRAAYDALPWPERETASRLCFPDTPWAHELSGIFGDVRAGRLRLLRQVDLFLNCDDDELAALAHSLQEQAVATGAVLLRAGAGSPGVWVVEAGEVVVWRGDQELAELHRGDSFGAQELLEGKPGERSYQAVVASSLLFIPADEFQALTRDLAPHAAEALDAATSLRLLERLPMFTDMPRNTLRGLAHVAQQQHFEPRSVVVRQGQPSGMFYIIKQGHAAVLTRSTAAGDTQRLHVVAQLGPEEFFGELELLRGTPPVANVVALTPLVALALPHAAVQALLTGDGGVAKRLEQIGTGRLIALREQAGGAA